jgi:hypothetical protein
MRLLLITLIKAFLLLACVGCSVIPVTPPLKRIVTAAPISNPFYVVDGKFGSDSNPGTQAQPWKTIQFAISTISAGDIINVLGGSYNGNLIITKSMILDCGGCTLNGRIQVDASNVTIRNITMNRPVMFGLLSLGDNAVYENLTVLRTELSTDCSGCDDMDGIRVAGNNVTLRNIKIDMSGKTDIGDAHPDCIQFATWNKRASNIVVDGLYCNNNYEANDTGSTGFQLATEKYGWENITIKNSVLIAKTCILAYNGQSGLTFEHNTCIGRGTAGGYGIYSAQNTNDYFNNNIFVNHDNPILATGGLADTGNNIIYCPSSACKSDNSFPHSGQLWDINPQLDENYRPLPGSPACLSNGYIGAFPCH